MPQPFLIRVCQALAQARVRYAVVGGHAVALHGAVRGTVDVDVAVVWSKAAIVRAEEALQSLGLTSRLPITAEEIFLYREEYVRNRNLLAWSFWNPEDPSEIVDILVDYDLKGRRTKTVSVGDEKVVLLSRTDLIEMKRKSGQPQDLADVKALEAL